MHAKSFFQLFLMSLLGSNLSNEIAIVSSEAELRGGDSLPPTPPTTNKVNVLIIMADDFRTADLYPYAADPLELPNLRGLADGSTAFKASTVYPVCAPSRSAFITGVDYPNTITFDQNFFQLSLESMLGSVRKLGSYYVGMHGKVIHEYNEDLKKQLFYRMNQTNVPRLPTTSGNTDCGKQLGCVIAKNKLSDNDVTNTGLKFLDTANNLIEQHIFENFFLILGFHRPHIETASFKKNPIFYTKALPDIAEPSINTNGNPALAHRTCDELNAFRLGAKKIISGNIKTADDITSSVKLTGDIRGLYFDALFTTDYYIGIFLNKIDKLGFKNNTIIIFTADHGFSLGEKNLWCKNTLYEEATDMIYPH